MARVLSLVPDAKPDGHGWRTRCPAHNGESSTSLSITQGDDGRVLLKCHGGCQFSTIVAKLGLKECDLFEPIEPAQTTPRLKPVKEVRSFASANEAAKAYAVTHGQWDSLWTYRNAAGAPVGLVLRWDTKGGGKDIRPAWRIGDRWQLSLPTERRTLYALDHLANDPTGRVFVAEGEKCAEQLAVLGFLATTSPSGSSSAAKADWSPLAGREVVILPDADDSGRKYAEKVLGLLLALAPPARAVIAPMPGLTAGEDIVEFVERVHGGDADAARTAIAELASTALAPSVLRLPQITFAELLKDPRLRTKPETIASGWEPFDRAQPFEAIERGTKLVLAAPPGCYKTATMLRLARGFAEQGHRVAWMAAEMQPRALLRRMLCQMAGLDQSAIFSACPDHVRKFADATHRLQGFAHLIECQRAPIGFDELERAAGVAEVVFVDYLQLVRHPQHDVRGHEKLEEVMGQIAELSQRDGVVFIIASAQGREGGGEKRGIHNATRGSSSIEFTVDALYCASKPEPTSNGTVVVFDCFKQREGAALPIEVPIDHHTGAIAEVEYE
jgi:hypothetical protein